MSSSWWSGLAQTVGGGGLDQGGRLGVAAAPSGHGQGRERGETDWVPLATSAPQPEPSSACSW
jgi:hypothetical protein